MRRSKNQAGFTLIELLVVISIIAILAAMLLPVIQLIKKKALIRQAKTEIGLINMALQEYDSTYGFMPTTSAARASAFASSDDFTYGTFYGAFGIIPFKTPAPPGTKDIISTGRGNPGSYQTNNAEIMAVLLDLETYHNSAPTINAGHVKNPQRRAFLNATMVSDTKSAGVGPDGIYRDPWKNPYIITLDMNNDNKARDAFYSNPIVSEDPTSRATPKPGLNGLLPGKDATGRVVYEAISPVMIWSAGPDGMIDDTISADKGVNRDNLLSWK
jgi:prepilin-type N-terminal cleavage/methylation domain-containing protein